MGLSAGMHKKSEAARRVQDAVHADGSHGDPDGVRELVRQDNFRSESIAFLRAKAQQHSAHVMRHLCDVSGSPISTGEISPDPAGDVRRRESRLSPSSMESSAWSAAALLIQNEAFQDAGSSGHVTDDVSRYRTNANNKH